MARRATYNMPTGAIVMINCRTTQHVVPGVRVDTRSKPPFVAGTGSSYQVNASLKRVQCLSQMDMQTQVHALPGLSSMENLVNHRVKLVSHYMAKLRAQTERYEKRRASLRNVS